MNERYSPSLPSRTLAGCIFVNVLLAVVKVLSGIVGNSQALIADGIESLLDIFSSLVVWGGLKVAIQPPSVASLRPWKSRDALQHGSGSDFTAWRRRNCHRKRA